MRIVPVAAILVAGVAFADSAAQTNGIKIGDGRLHALLTAAVGYDSAAGYAPTTGSAPQLVGDLLVQPTGGLSFTLDTPSTVVNLAGTASYLWYPGLISGSTKAVSHPIANVILDTYFNKLGAVEFDLGDAFSDSDQGTNTVAGIGLLSLYNSVHAAAPIHPGGGAIEVTPKVKWDVAFFSQLLAGNLPGCGLDISCNPALLHNMNYSDLQFGLGGKWKFLPKTAVVLDALFDYQTYFNSQASIGTNTPNSSTNLPGLVLHVQAGLSGLITSHISTLLLIGGAGDFGGSGLATVIGQAEVGYLGQNFTVRGGFLRQQLPIPIFGSDVDNRAYLEGRLTLGGRFSASLLGGFDYITYAATTRADELVLAQANVGYQFTSFFSASITYSLWMRFSNVSSVGLNYMRHQPMLNLTLSY